jgi:hypothetical protein
VILFRGGKNLVYTYRRYAMKKNWLSFAVVFMTIVGIALMMGCPSEAEEGEKIDEPDIIFVGGKYQFVFDTPKIVHGKSYEVILTIDDCDESFVGSHLGGKICYKMDLDGDDEKVLSGWQNSIPDTVSKNIKTYKWTYEAGQKYSDSITPEADATTPADGKQYFAFTAQNSDWKEYAASVNFNIKGRFEVKEAAVISDWVSEGTITLGNVDGIAGKGELTAADVAKIKAMPANSKITFTFNVTVGSNGADPGNGICGIGPDWNGGINIAVPGDAPTGAYTFTHDLAISSLLAVASNAIILNVYNGATITKAELFKPGT